MQTSIFGNMKNLDLLITWTFRTIRSRYQQSLLGILWVIFQPLATVAVLTVVFSFIVSVDTGDIPYIVFSYSAIVPWFLLSTSLTDMTESIVTNMNLVSKIFFPREVLVLAALLARLVDYIISIGLLIILMALFGLPIFQLGWIYIPLLLIIQLAMALGLGFLGSAFNTFFRDIRHLVALGIQLWFYATPIIYPVTLVPKRFQSIYYLNPMTPIIEGYRAVFLKGEPPSDTLWISMIISGLILGVGYLVFKRLEPKFADLI